MSKIVPLTQDEVVARQQANHLLTAQDMAIETITGKNVQMRNDILSVLASHVGDDLGLAASKIQGEINQHPAFHTRDAEHNYDPRKLALDVIHETQTYEGYLNHINVDVRPIKFADQEKLAQGSRSNVAAMQDAINEYEQKKHQENPGYEVHHIEVSGHWGKKTETEFERIGHEGQHRWKSHPSLHKVLDKLMKEDIVLHPGNFAEASSQQTLPQTGAKGQPSRHS